MTDSLKERLRSVGNYDLERLPPDLKPGPEDKPPFHICHEALARIEEFEDALGECLEQRQANFILCGEAQTTIAKLEGENKRLCELWEKSSLVEANRTIAALQGKLDRALEEIDGHRLFAPEADAYLDLKSRIRSILSDLSPDGGKK